MDSEKLFHPVHFFHCVFSSFIMPSQNNLSYPLYIPSLLPLILLYLIASLQNLIIKLTFYGLTSSSILIDNKV